MAAAKLTKRLDERGGRSERRGDLQSVSRFKRKLLGSSLDGSRGEKGDQRAGEMRVERRVEMWMGMRGLARARTGAHL